MPPAGTPTLPHHHRNADIEPWEIGKAAGVAQSPRAEGDAQSIASRSAVAPRTDVVQAAQPMAIAFSKTQGNEWGASSSA
jgi:hypothetical protein